MVGLSGGTQANKNREHRRAKSKQLNANAKSSSSFNCDDEDAENLNLSGEDEDLFNQRKSKYTPNRKQTAQWDNAKTPAKNTSQTKYGDTTDKRHDTTYRLKTDTQSSGNGETRSRNYKKHQGHYQQQHSSTAKLSSQRSQQLVAAVADLDLHQSLEVGQLAPNDEFTVTDLPIEQANRQSSIRQQ